MLFKKLRRVTSSIKSIRYMTTENYRNEWRAAIGLEIHAQLLTKTKLFSSAPYYYGAPVNSTVSLFDAAIPGTLPVLNKRAVELAVISALALGCDINPISYFDRKHYFYPDLPCGYQITQQRLPFAENGSLDFAVYQPGVHSRPYYKTSFIKQIQLEQDSGKLLHDLGKNCYIDLNRAGVALIEIVFQPDLEDEQEACALIKDVLGILERAQSCSGKMEEGSFRIDVNISIRDENKNLGTRTEIKNIGSLHGVSHAIQYEKNRQINLIKNGYSVKNQTLAWDKANNRTCIMRDKEDAQDYRFMPEPNLPPLRIIIDEVSEKYHKNVKFKNTVLDLRHLKNYVPITPQADRLQLIEKHGLSDIFAYNLVYQEELFQYFKEILYENSCRNSKIIYLVLMYQFLNALGKKKLEIHESSVSPSQLGEVVDMLQNRIISHMTSEFLVEELVRNTNFLSPSELVEKNNLKIISNEKELKKLCLRVLERETALVSSYKKRKKAVFNELMKKVIEESYYRADTKILPAIMTDILNDFAKNK